jgi:hypothetical protein
MIYLNSSSIRGIWYNRDTKQLNTIFFDGSLYNYEDIDPETVMQIMFPSDGSHGRTFRQLIVKNPDIKYRKVDLNGNVS